MNSHFTTCIFLFGAIIFLGVTSCQPKNDVVPISPEKYLASDVSRSWRMTASTRDTVKNLNPSCKVSSIQNTDNKLIFKNGGAFQYDPGTITKDESCQVSGCCSDLANLIGNWVIRNDSLITTVNARIDNGQTTPIKQVELIKGRIVKLDENELVLSNVYIATFNRIP